MDPRATSKDGTRIAFDRTGEGPALIMVGGALSDRSGSVPFAKALAPYFTVYSYDRRGRGDSTDTPPYAVEREIEDVEALIDQAGGSAFLYGVSSGAVLFLEAASRLPAKVKKLAVYEPPLIVGGRPPPPPDYARRVDEHLAAGRRSEAVELFLTEVVGMPAEAVAQLRSDPAWGQQAALAHTLPYDIAIAGPTMTGAPLPAGKWAGAAMPTLVMAGGGSPAWMRDAAQALVDTLPNAQRRILEGQTHAAAPEVIAPVLKAFFLG